MSDGFPLQTGREKANSRYIMAVALVHMISEMGFKAPM